MLSFRLKVKSDFSLDGMLKFVKCSLVEQEGRFFLSCRLTTWILINLGRHARKNRPLLIPRVGITTQLQFRLDPFFPDFF